MPARKTFTLGILEELAQAVAAALDEARAAIRALAELVA